MDRVQANRIRGFVRRVAWLRYGLAPDIADDICQNILLLVWKLFPMAPPPMKWIARATHLECLRMFRTEGRRRQREVEFARRQGLTFLGRTRSIERKLELKFALERALGHSLRHSELTGSFVADLAAAYGVPKGTLYRKIWELRKIGLSPPRSRAGGRKPDA